MTSVYKSSTKQYILGSPKQEGKATALKRNVLDSIRRLGDVSS